MGKKYPSCVKNWEENWYIPSTFYAYPPEIRKIIEGLNRQFRKITKNKPSFTNDDFLRKILYLASKNIVEHGTAYCRNGNQVISQLEIYLVTGKPGNWLICWASPALETIIHGYTAHNRS